MFAVTSAVFAAEEMIVHPGEMPFPPIVFGLIALVAFLALALVTFSFRNMAEQHPEHSRYVPFEPIAHPGTPKLGNGDPFDPAAQKQLEH